MSNRSDKFCTSSITCILSKLWFETWSLLRMSSTTFEDKTHILDNHLIVQK
jgi:hypothetical protein